MKIRNTDGELRIMPSSSINCNNEKLVMYGESLLDFQIIAEIIKLINNPKNTTQFILQKLESCNSGS